MVQSISFSSFCRPSPLPNDSFGTKAINWGLSNEHAIARTLRIRRNPQSLSPTLKKPRTKISHSCFLRSDLIQYSCGRFTFYCPGGQLVDAFRCQTRSSESCWIRDCGLWKSSSGLIIAMAVKLFTGARIEFSLAEHQYRYRFSVFACGPFLRSSVAFLTRFFSVSK